MANICAKGEEFLGITMEEKEKQNGEIEEFLAATTISRRVCELGEQLRGIYRHQNPLVLGVLNGGFMFLSDLVRAMGIALEVDFVRLKSYNGTQSSGEVRFLLNHQIPVRGRHILVVEDIVETGLSMNFLKAQLLAEGPASLKICCLLHKPTPENRQFVDYSGFEIGKEFVVGYGLDYQEKYRNLPFIGRYLGEH